MVGTGQKIADILAAIYYDINCVCQGRKIANQMPNMADINRYRWECQGAAALVSRAVALALSPDNLSSHTGRSPQDQQELQRLMQLTSKLGWKIVSICAHSEAFRRACKEAEAHVWNGFVGQIDANRPSIELFARSRNLEWRGPLLKHARHTLPQLQQEFAPYRKLCDEHPHHHVRTLDGCIRRPIYEGYPQVHINNSIFDPKDWEDQGHEDEYAEVLDPTLRSEDDGHCDLCGSEESCSCVPTSLPGQLVELIDYPDKGTGVRSLANFKKGAILDEFVGIIYPPDYDDPVYSACLFSPTQKGQIASISPKRFGNWTRFLNHSCDPSTVFREMVIGDRLILAVEAVRDIFILEEITVHYGDSYWTAERKCQCGAPSCLSLEEGARTSTRPSD